MNYGQILKLQKLWVMKIWVNFWKMKYMGNVDVGKVLKSLPIIVKNIWLNILPMPKGHRSSPLVHCCSLR